MKKNIFKCNLIAALIILFTVNSTAQSKIVEDGVIDLSTIDWGSNPYIKLEGNWHFYWQEFLSSSSLIDSTKKANKKLAPLPGPWTKILNDDGNKLPQAGYGTYHLKIKLPNKDQVYALKMYSVFTAYKMYVNNKLVTEVGKIGKTKEESTPEFSTQEVPFIINKVGNNTDQIAEIIIQSSNFHHRRAGLQKPIHIGTIDSVVEQTEKGIIINILLIGIILIIGFNHVLMYALRRLDIANLIFGLLSIIMILRNLSTGERLIQTWIPNLSWEMLVKLDNFSGFATISFFSIYFFFSYRRDFPKVMFYILTSIGALITILVFSTSAWFYGQFRLLFEAYIGLGGFYLVFGVLLFATFRKREGSFLTFLGMFLLYATAINDVLSSMGVLNTAFIAPYGIAAFMIIQSFLLTRKSAVALKQNQSLSGELREEKLKLEERISKRTQELTQQTSELEKHKTQQDTQNWINSSLNNLSDIMRQNKGNMEVLADKLLSTMVKETKSSMGALYFLNDEDNTKKLELIAHYGLSKEAITKDVDLQEGLTGKCFTTGKVAHINDLPTGYFEISSGLGKSTPKSVSLYPMIVDEKVIGVIEIATFKELTNAHKEYISKGISSIGAQLNIVKMNSETKTLLSNYEKYENELKQKEEDYRLLQEELEMLKEQK